MPEYYSHHLGGSKSDWPNSGERAAKDGREYISFWGDTCGGSGGCCFVSSKHANYGGAVSANSWGRAFTVHIKNVVCVG